MVIIPCSLHNSYIVCHDDIDQLVPVSSLTDKQKLRIFLKKKLEFFRPNSSLETLNSNAASMWVKIVSSWLCLALYTWSLVAPIVLPDRDFGGY